MPMAMQFVTKNTDKPNKPAEITRRNQNDKFRINLKAVADMEKYKNKIEQMAAIASSIQRVL